MDSERIIKRQAVRIWIASACRKSMCHLAIYTKGVRLWGTPGEGSPPKNSPLDCFSPLLRSFGTKISQPAGCDEGAVPQPRRLLKKAGENFWLFFYRKTVYRQTEAVQIGPPSFCALSVHDVSRGCRTHRPCAWRRCSPQRLVQCLKQDFMLRPFWPSLRGISRSLPWRACSRTRSEQT